MEIIFLSTDDKEFNPLNTSDTGESWKKKYFQASFMGVKCVDLVSLLIV